MGISILPGIQRCMVLKFIVAFVRHNVSRDSRKGMGNEMTSVSIDIRSILSCPSASFPPDTPVSVILTNDANFC